MTFTIKPTSRFQKDLKHIQRRGYDVSLVTNVIKKLANGEQFPEKNRDYSLSGDFLAVESATFRLASDI